MSADVTLALTGAEWNRLAELEETIEAGVKQMDATWAALREIRDAKLYRSSHKTFEEYVADRWNISRARAYQHINTVEDKEMLSTTVDKAILDSMGERQMRALRAAPEDERAEVIIEAAARDGGAPTTKTIEAVIAEKAPAAADAVTVRRDDPDQIAMLLKKPAAPPPVPEKSAEVRDGNEWYTPPTIIDLVRTVMGSIDLDPASCAKANETVGATTYYSLERGENGLTADYDADHLFENPPYDNTGEWVEKLIAEYRAGNVREAMLLVLAKTETAWFDLAWEYGAVCIIRGRLSHIAGDGGKEQTGRCGSAMFYFGPNPEKFAEVFAHRGRVLPATPWAGRPAEKAVA